MYHIFQVSLELYCAFVVVAVPLYEVFASGNFKKTRKEVETLESEEKVDDGDTPVYPRPAHLKNIKKEV